MCIEPYCQKLVYMIISLQFFFLIMKLHLRCLGLYSRICTMPTYIGIGILHIHEQRPIHASTSALHPHSIRKIRWCPYQFYFYSNLSKICQNWWNVCQKFSVSTNLTSLRLQNTFTLSMNVSQTWTDRFCWCRVIFLHLWWELFSCNIQICDWSAQESIHVRTMWLDHPFSEL